MNAPAIVVPILLNDQHSLLSHPEGRSLLEDLFRTLVESGPACIAVGRETPALSLAARCGMETLNLALLSDSPALPMPSGTAPALNALRKRGRLEADTPVLAVDCEAVRLTGDEAALALVSLDEPGVGVAVTETEHHPCQLYLHEQLLDAAVITLLDSEFLGLPPHEKSGNAVTVPFPFDWEAFSPGTPEGRWTAYSDTEAPGSKNAQGCGGNLLRVADHKARFACTLKNRPRDLIGICLPFPESGPFLRLIEGVPSIEFGNDAKLAGKCLINARGIRADGTVEGQGTVYHTAETGSLGLPPEAFGPDIAHVAYTMARIDGPTYDMRSPFPQSRGLWKFDSDHARMVNTVTGDAITGRQQLPVVWQTTGTLAAGTAESLVAAARRLPDKGLRPIRLGLQSGGMRVKGDYELLKALSLRERNEYEADDLPS